MLKCIRLNNFVSHQNTEIKFSEGVNVFVGENGAGKSSVIDGITYALYGEHGRGDKRNIVRKHSKGGFVELEFQHNGKEYMIYRKFNDDGSLDNATIRDKNNILASGGRGRKGVKEEGVTKQVESILGLNYEDASIATIIRQGELDAIIDLKPKEIKELLNRVIGIDKLDKAYQEFRDVLDDFKTRLRNEIGYDLADLERIEKELETNEKKRNEAIMSLKSLKEMLNEKRNEKESLEKRINELQLLQGKYNEYLERKQELKKYLEKKREEITKRCSEMREIIEQGYKYLDILKDNTITEKRYNELLEQEKRLVRLDELKKQKLMKENEKRRCEEDINDIKKKIKKLEDVEPINIEYSINDKINLIKKEIADINESLGKIEEKLYNYEIIQRDGVCPVCESRISNADLSSKINQKINEQKMLQNKRQMLEEEEENLRELSYKQKIYEKAKNELNEAYERLNKLQHRYEDIIKSYRDVVDELARYDIKGDKKSIENERRELERKIKKQSEAKAWLDIHHISNMDDIKMLEIELNSLYDMQSLLNNIKDVEINKLVIDDYAKELINRINMVENDAKRYDRIEHETLLNRLRKCDEEIEEVISNKGKMESIIDEATKQIEKLKEAKMMIEHASKYIEFYEKIREEVYHKRLPAELREWVFDELSKKATEYVNILNIGISNIILREEKNDVNIDCYGSANIDIHSMSGGEKMAIALALRFAIASIRGKGSTDFIILDEPTIHLDQQKKKALVELVSRLGNKALRQIILITHDEEIFENAEIDNIIRFEKSGGVSIVK